MSTNPKADRPLSEAWGEICAYWRRRGDVPPMNQLPGLWEFSFGEDDARWEVKVNGHAREINNVPSYHAIALYNGWPALMMNPYGGTGLVGGDGGRAEDMFIDAIKAAG